MNNFSTKYDSVLISPDFSEDIDDELLFYTMEWARPEHSKNKVDEAGCILVDYEPTNQLNREAAYQIINNWRASHNYPLNTFQVRLRSRAKAIDNKSIVVQRIKRLSSIGHKLERFKTMRLSQIQDIGGCRAI